MMNNWTLLISYLSWKLYECNQGIAYEIISDILKGRTLHGNLQNLWGPTDISLMMKSSKYDFTDRSTLIYSGET